MTIAPSRRLRNFVAALLSIAVAGGCQSTRQFAPKVEQDGKFLVHVVASPKEEIGPLCAWYSGEAECEERISRDNPGLNLASLQVGDRILVPFAILHRVERYQAGVTPPPIGASPSAAPTTAPTPTEVVGDGIDPLVGDDFQDLPQQPVASGESPSRDPLEQLMRDQEEIRRQQPQAPAAPTEQVAPGTPTLETFDLQDAPEAPHSEQPQAAIPQGAPVKTSGGNRASATNPPAVDQPSSASEQIESLRRELGLAQ